MKKRISVIVNELGVASVEEIESILRECYGGIKKKTLSLKLKELEKERVIFKILPKENTYEMEGYIAGSGISSKDDFEIKRLIMERGHYHRNLQCIDWKLFSSRIVKLFIEDIKRLQGDLEKFIDEPKNIEMRYFDLSIKYHELYGLFFDRYDTDFLKPVENLLGDCRDQLNKKEF